MPRKLTAATIALAVALCGAVAASTPALAAGVTPTIETTITSGPADGATIEDESPSFGFAATRDGAPFADAAFHCSVDDSPPTDCTSPFTVEALDPGQHVFSVYAEDPADFTADPEPATRSFAVQDDGEEECESLGAQEGSGEEGEAAECEEEPGSGGLPPEECLLRSARARLFSFASQDRVRLVIRYTSFSAADVSIEYRLTGGRGSLKLGGAHERLAEKGLIRIGERLSEAEMERVRAARRFTVSMSLSGAPQYCQRYDTRQLTIRRSIHSQVVWFQSDSIFGG